MKAQYWYYKGSDIIGSGEEEKKRREEQRKRRIQKGRLITDIKKGRH